jgi:long-chain fatty acid transport protein
MKSKSTGISLSKLAAVAMVAMPCVSAFATNGYFSHGYGMKAKGMGGAAVAMTDSAFAGANNPAIAAWAGDRAELGVDVFMPERGMQRSGSAAGLNAQLSSDSTSFLIPEFGYNRAINDKMGVGISVYGNGGMNTDYAGGSIPAGVCGPSAANVLCGSGRVGVDLMQLIVAPTFAYKVSEKHSVGVSPLLVQQIFKADGLQMFQSWTPNSSNVTNNGYDSSTGFGMRLGYLGKLSDSVSIGASYAPRISMSKFSKYAGLFADGGNFDIPENYTLGTSIQATPTVVIALDYQHIGYSAVPSIGNASNSGTVLGAANGPGFGWGDVNATKVGIQWQANAALTVRAGINVGDNPVKSRDVTFNILAPGVVTTHYTLGATYALSPSSEITAAYMVASSNSVSGSSLFNGPMGGMAGNETVKMNQQSIGVQFGWRW